jgi:CMP-N-acetylneuraminic acid synthetase
MVILGLIPARGGSKGIPKKNIARLCHKPLIVYTIEEALRSRYLTKVVTSTENKEIARIAKNSGSEVIMRPKNLARDYTPTFPVVEHALNYLRKRSLKPDIIVLLQPTAPLRKAAFLDEAIEILLKNKRRADAIVSLCKIDEPHPYKLKVIRNGFVQPFMKGAHGFMPRQLLPQVYRLNGAFYIVKTAVCLEKKTLLPERTLPYFMEERFSVNIDTPRDLVLAEYFLKLQKRRTG